MKILITRLAGILLIMAAIGGLLFAITGLIGITQIRPVAIASVQNNLDLLRNTLQTTAAGFLITQESLSGAKASLEAMQSTLETTSQTMQSTEPLISSLSDLAAEDLPATVRSAQDSLESAAESAQVIDTVLSALSFLPGINYNPDIPLSASLKELSANMENLPQTFIVMQSNLQDTGQNLQTIQVDLLLLIDALEQIEKSLIDSEKVITGYQDSLVQVSNKIDALAVAAPKSINMISLAGSIFLIWMAIAQLGLFIQGWQLIESTANKLPSKTIPKTPPSKKIASSGDDAPQKS